MNLAISPAKASRLYWLGRYTERVVMTLHLLRRFSKEYDSAQGSWHLDFARRMGIDAEGRTAAEFVREYLYGSEPWTIATSVAMVKNNAMLLRGDIRTETLAYIELASNYYDKAVSGVLGVYSLQYVTDTLLAFWGAADENVPTRGVRNILGIGRWVEKLDMMLRFGYDRERVLSTLARLEGIDESELNLCDAAEMQALEQLCGEEVVPVDELRSRLNALFAA